MSEQPASMSRRDWAIKNMWAGAALAGSVAGPMAGCSRDVATWQRVVVDGPSMNPTLWGRHRLWNCRRCDAPAKVDELFVARVLARTDSGSPGVPRCWHCGEPVAKERLTLARPRPAEVVLVRPASETDVSLVRPLDLVLARIGGQLRIKRVASIDGPAQPNESSDRPETPASEKWSLEPLSTRFPPVTVDIDRLRDNRLPRESENASRWRLLGAQAEALGWTRFVGGGWRNAHAAERRSGSISASASEGQQRAPSVDESSRVYLQYTHRAVERGHRPAVIANLYPGNLAIARRTEPAPVLGLDLTVTLRRRSRAADGVVQAAFCVGDRSTDWVSARPLETDARRQETPARRWRICSQDRGDTPLEAEGPAAERPVLTPRPTRPITLRFDARDVLEISDLVVWWRMSEPEHWLANNGVELPPRHCWLAGDNLPVSVDSRSFGAVPIAHLVGVVLGKLRAAEDG